MKRKLFFLAICTALLLACASETAVFQDGDIIFQESKSAQSAALKAATNSRYTHCGILFQDNGEWYVYEAVQPVRKTEFKRWRWSGVDGHYVVKRMKKPLSDYQRKAIRELAAARFGINYDLQFKWSDDRLYCSEFVWKLFKEGAGVELCRPARFGDFDLSAMVVQQKIGERFDGPPPMDEPVVAPVQLLESPLLSTVVTVR